MGSSDTICGGCSLAFDDDEEDGDRGRKPDSEPNRDSSAQSDSSASLRRPRGGTPGVGNALREAYQEALREDVPPEMLDLLGKLG